MSEKPYLNEKHHEPIKDADRPESTGGSAWTGTPPSASPPHAAAEPPVNEDLLENAYWEFDARKNGYSVWKGSPQSERDAFKSAARNLLVGSLVASPSAQPIAQDGGTELVHSEYVRETTAEIRRLKAELALERDYSANLRASLEQYKGARRDIALKSAGKE